VVLDSGGHAVPGATIVAGAADTGRSGHQVITTDARGRFAWPLPSGTEQVCLVAYKEGFAPSGLSAPASALVDPHDLKLRLGTPTPFAAVLVDVDGRPVAGAKVRIEMIAHASERKEGAATLVSTGFEQICREVISGSPVEDLFVTTTDASGAFRFRAIDPVSGLKLGVTTADGRVLRVLARSGAAGPARRSPEDQGSVTTVPGETARLVSGLVQGMLEDQGFVVALPGGRARLVVVPAARVAGRVVTKLPGVRVGGLTATYQESHPPGPGVYRRSANFGEQVQTDAEGRFTFDGLNEGTVNVFVHGDGGNRDWTYRAAQDVNLAPGATSEVTIELIRGVEVEGTVVAQGTGAPVEGAQVGVYGPFRPRTGAMTTGATTDAQGRYRYRLPSGESYFYVIGPPSGFTRLSGERSSRTVTIPDRALRHRVPPIELTTAVTVGGRVLDATGAPVAGATVVGLCEGGICRPFGGTETVTDARGAFRLPPGPNHAVPVGQAARLLIRLRDRSEHEATAVPTAGGEFLVHHAAAGQRRPRVQPHRS
jgi:hypothetical protein